jgi:peptide deformylase
MAVREILLLGNPVLRAKCATVKNFSDPSLNTTIDDLRDTLADFRARHGFGRGIAAPQIGITERIIFINIDEPIVLINPRISKQSRKIMTLWDDCFSFPDIMVKVKRNVNITVEFHDASGKKRNLEASNSLSELLQHEIDHVNGILAIDRAIDSKHIVLRSEWKKLFHPERAVYQL